MMRATNSVALAGLTMPVWVPSLEQISRGAGAAVPVLSALWLVVQIARHLHQWKAGK